MRLVHQWTDCVVPLVAAVCQAACVVDSPSQDQLIVERHTDAVVDCQERRDAVTASTSSPILDLTLNTRRLELGALHGHVEPQLIHGVWVSTTYVTAELTTKVAEDWLKCVPVRISCTDKHSPLRLNIKYTSR